METTTTIRFQLPKWESYYGNSASAQMHALCFYTPQGKFWYSYTTLVAFRANEGNRVPYIHENDWGPTTGEHLNAIDFGNKGERLNSTAFDAKFLEVFGQTIH